jgi:hypothetical protein
VSRRGLAEERQSLVLFALPPEIDQRLLVPPHSHFNVRPLS